LPTDYRSILTIPCLWRRLEGIGGEKPPKPGVEDLTPEWTTKSQDSPEEFLEDFIRALEQARPLFDWILVADSGMEPDSRSRTRYRIRGVGKKGTARGVTFEPVGAVCFVRTGEVYDEGNWSGAARAIGLPSLCMAELIAAANDHTWIGPGGDREPVEYLRGLRLRLIQAVGLTQPNSQTASPARNE
jgi:hypothetical protein